MLMAAQQKARSAFTENQSLPPSSPEAAAQIAQAEEVAKFLRQNVVQGQKMEGGQESDKYQLRIHDEIERGDNSTIKTAGGGVNLAASGLCGG